MSIKTPPTSQLTIAEQQRIWKWQAETRAYLKAQSHNKLVRMCLSLIIENFNLKQKVEK
jgi:hypothetical protein